MPLFTGGAHPQGIIPAGIPGGSAGQKAFFLARQILRRSPPAAALVLAGNAIYYLLKQLNENDDADQAAAVQGPAGFAASIEMPPMWRRDP